jgi:DNA-directed RNA polymerase subunit L
VLYNGTEPYLPFGELRLSDAFMGMDKGEAPQLELVVKVVNINYGENPEVLEKCKDLNGYALFVAKIRGLQSEGATLEEAVKRAAKECLKEGVLTEFLSKYKYKELINLITLFYDEDMAIEIAKEEAYEDGIEKGTLLLIERMLIKGKSVESVAYDTDVPIEQIMEINERLMSDV